MRLKTKRGQIQSNVDMTPMIDIVFQLILFFLVSTTFAVLPGIKLNLPTSHTAEGTSVLGITIAIDENGKMFFNDEQIEYDELASCLANYDTAKVPKEEFPVSLEADAEVKNGMIVQIFDVIRENGFSVINLRTTAEE